MKKGKLIGGIIVLAVIAFFAYYYFSGKEIPIIPVSFDDGLKELRKIDIRYGVEGTIIAPISESDNEKYLQEVSSYKQELQLKQATDDVKALILLAEAKEYAARMQQNMLGARKIIESITTPAETDCGAGGNMGKTYQYFTEAGDNASMLAQKITEFEERYPSKTEKVKEFAESALLTGEAMSIKAEQLQETIKEYCPT